MITPFSLRGLSTAASHIAFAFVGMLSATLAHYSPPAWVSFAALAVCACVAGYLGGMADAQEARR